MQEIPISFNSFLPKSLPKTVIVRSIYGNYWEMAFRICCGDTERFVMVHGWKRIVKDEDLKGGEFLEFEFDGSRCFNFCIYGRVTCKKLRSSVQIKEIEDESDGEDDKHSNDITFLDDDDDQYYGDEDKSSEDITVLDDINDVQDYGEEDTSSEDIIVIDDDDDQDYDDDDYADDENERWRGVKTERKEKGIIETFCLVKLSEHHCLFKILAYKF